jgi:hypothetical protein
MKVYMIRNTEPGDDWLYWDNDNGWQPSTSASLFDVRDYHTLDLPIGGEWVVVEIDDAAFKPASSKLDPASKPTLVIVLEGGIVQSVCTDDTSLELERIAVIDYDDDLDEADLSDVIQSDGSISKAWVYDMGLEKLQVEIVDAEDEPEEEPQP